MSQRTEIASLGEFGLIEHLTKNIEFKNARKSDNPLLGHVVNRLCIILSYVIHADSIGEKFRFFIFESFLSSTTL